MARTGVCDSKEVVCCSCTLDRRDGIIAAGRCNWVQGGARNVTGNDVGDTGSGVRYARPSFGRSVGPRRKAVSRS